MKSRKLNFAIIGCGSVSIDHAKAIKKLGHNIYIALIITDIVYICLNML